MAIDPGPNALARRSRKERKVIGVISGGQFRAVLINKNEHIVVDCNDPFAAESRFKTFVLVDCVINLLIVGIVFGNEFDGVGKGVALRPYERTGETACRIGLSGEFVVGGTLFFVADIHCALRYRNIVTRWGNVNSVKFGSGKSLGNPVVPCCRKNRLLACARGIGDDADAADCFVFVDGVFDGIRYGIGVLNVGIAVVPNFVIGIVNLRLSVEMSGKSCPIPSNRAFVCGCVV